MPKVQYVCHPREQRITANMPVPKRSDSILHWFRAAQKVIKEIPVIGDKEGWNIEFQEANTDWIRFDLRSLKHGKANVVILRQLGQFGGD